MKLALQQNKLKYDACNMLTYFTIIELFYFLALGEEEKLCAKSFLVADRDHTTATEKAQTISLADISKRIWTF